MASLRGTGPQSGPLDDGPDFPTDATPEAPAEVANVVEGTVVEAAGRAANYVASRNLGPSTIALVQYIAANAADTAELNTVILEQMAAKILNAESPSDIVDPFGTMSGRDMYNRPLWITGCTFLESDYTEGFPYYVSFAIQDQQTGSTSVVTVGGEKVCYQAAGFDMHDAWPQMLMICESEKETKAGFRPLELRAAA